MIIQSCIMTEVFLETKWNFIRFAIAIVSPRFFMNINKMVNLSGNRSELDSISKAVLQAQFASSVSFVVTGLPCCIGNLLLCTTIIKTKNLRSNFYLCLMHTAIAEMLYCLFYSLIGLKRIYLILNNMEETTTPLNCVGILFPGASVRNVSVAQSVTIAFDRLLCVATPVSYRKISIKHLQISNLLMWLLPLGIMIGGCCLYLVHSDVIPNCTLGLTWAPEYAEMFSGMGLWLVGMIICQYVTIVPILLLYIHSGIKKG